MRLAGPRPALRLLSMTGAGLLAASLRRRPAAAAATDALSRSLPLFVPPRRRSGDASRPFRSLRRPGTGSEFRNDPGPGREGAPRLPLRSFSTMLGDESGGGNQQKPLLLDPKAPLRPLLSSEGSREDHLSRYALPPTILGEDDFRPDLKPGQRVVAFGDVHGDLAALRAFLIAAEVLDPESSDDEPVWAGGETICVQTGDVLDRGEDELACFRLLATLARQARRAGGALLLLYGNHESLNAAGLFQYADPGGNREFEDAIGGRIDYNYGSNRWRLQFAGNQPSRWASLEPGGLLAEALLRNMLVACVVGRTVFVHAGLTAAHLRGVGDDAADGGTGGRRRYRGITRLNEEAREWILKGEGA